MTKRTNFGGVHGSWNNFASWDAGVPNGSVDAWIAESGSVATVDAPAYAHSIYLNSHQAFILDSAPIYLAAGGRLEIESGEFDLMQGGSINGGTLDVLFGDFVSLGGALNNVTIDGALDLSADNSALFVHNLIPSSAPGFNYQIFLTGYASILTFTGAQTLSHATVTFGKPGALAPNEPQIVFQAPANGVATLNFDATTSMNVAGEAQISQTANAAASITLRGATALSDGADLMNFAHLVNYGAFSLASTGDWTKLVLESSGSFAGSLQNRGTMSLSDKVTNLIDGQGQGAVTAMFQNLGTLRGAGTIGSGNGMLRFANGGLLDVNGVNTLTLDTGAPDVNGGSILVEGPGGLVVKDAIANTGGHIRAVNSSPINLHGGSINGGVLSLGVGSVLSATGGAASLSALSGVNVANNGLIEADDEATLTLDGGAAVTGSNVIEALDGATLALGTVKIAGATLTTDLGGQLIGLADSSTSLRNVTFSAGTDLVQKAGDALLLSGTIALESANGVQAEIQTGDALSHPALAGQTLITGIDVSGVTTLSGGGLVQLGDPTGGFGQIFSDANAWLVNQDTIQGAGFIGEQVSVPFQGFPTLISTPLSLVNRGVIDATGPSLHSLIVAVKNAINNIGGVFEATGGGDLEVQNDIVGGAVIVGAQSQAFVRGVRGVSLSFDNALGDTGKLGLDPQSGAFVNSPISGFFSDGLGNSDDIEFLTHDFRFGATPTWRFHENAGGTAGTLSLTDPLGHTAFPVLALAGHYLDAGLSASSATSSLFTLTARAGLVDITTSALENVSS